MPSPPSEPTRPTHRGRVLFTPSVKHVEKARLSDYARRVLPGIEPGVEGYAALHDWSVNDPSRFWQSIADYFAVKFSRQAQGAALARRALPGAIWFPGSELNYAEHALRHATGIAIVSRDEGGARREMSFDDLRDAVGRCRAGLVGLGVQRGDAVVGYLGNSEEAVVAFLACASLGAIWSSCPPEFGANTVLDRFHQIEPKVLIATNAYAYAGRTHDKSDELRRIQEGLPTLEATIVVDRLGRGNSKTFAELLSTPGPLEFEPLPFDHPLWILYSSGTTGKPKAIVQGHGGILLEHLKVLGLHHDLGPEDRFFWFSTTGWMMWNYLVSGLLLGSTIVLYEGSPSHPRLERLWSLIDEERLTTFGTSAPYITACRARGVRPMTELSLSTLRAIGSTGAPLPEEGFEWVYDSVKTDVRLDSASGGTDVCTAFLLGSPWLPVRAGELQCAALGAKVASFDEGGHAVTHRVGELVLLEPLPSMPTRFWNDDSGERLRAAYFERFEGVWHHGDFVRCFEDGAFVIYGRSDATLNRGGVRMGTSEFYRTVSDIEGLVDSLVVDTSSLENAGQLWLFVVASDALPFEHLVTELRRVIRTGLSPRHVPDIVCRVPDIPYTLSGKKLEVPVKRALMGSDPAPGSTGTLRNPEAFAALLDCARRAQQAQTQR